MPTTKPEGQSTVVAVYPDHDSADDAVRRLQSDGIPLQNLSIIGMDFQSVEKPLGFVTTGDVAKTGARVGAWTGGLFGLLVGAAFLIVPGIGRLVIAGPLAATLLGGIEGAGRGGVRRIGRRARWAGYLQGQGDPLRIPSQGRQVPGHLARRRGPDPASQITVHSRQSRDDRGCPSASGIVARCSVGRVFYCGRQCSQ